MRNPVNEFANDANLRSCEVRIGRELDMGDFKETQGFPERSAI